MKPTSNFVGPMLTDLYQLTMVHAYWMTGRHDEPAVFDLIIRKNPFGGEFTIFAGLEEVLSVLDSFRFSDDDIAFVRRIIPTARPEFFDWLRAVDCSHIRLFAPREGTLVFPLVPILRVEGPIAIAQLLETTILNSVNFASLIATSAARMRCAAGRDTSLVEFGLRRAQGPDGGVSASRYSYLGGVDATSNVLAGKLFGIPVKGTIAHSFVSSFKSLDEIARQPNLTDASGHQQNFLELVLDFRQRLGFTATKDGELAAFMAYAQASPAGFLALVDTYDTLSSGIPNFLSVALALYRLGYSPVGVRLDSGDLAYLSRATRQMFRRVSQQFRVPFEHLTIVASNDLNETTLRSLAEQGHEIDVFGIGTHLVTSQAQPALGGIYKLVEIGGRPAFKFSQESAKTTIPFRKNVYRLIGRERYPIVDLIVHADRPTPKNSERILVRHPFEAAKRVHVVPSMVVRLHECVWDGKLTVDTPSLDERRRYVLEQIESFRQDHLRALNPTPYKVSVDEKLYTDIHELWMREMPVREVG